MRRVAAILAVLAAMALPAGDWVVGADGTGLARVPGTDGAWEVYFSSVA